MSDSGLEMLIINTLNKLVNLIMHALGKKYVC